MEEKKMKFPPWTTFERGVLLQLMKQKEHMIGGGGRTDIVTVRREGGGEGWMEISTEYCSRANTILRSSR